ncbi:pentapeptide repeat-containing protein, partial [Rivihabitans pingtungensis]|uniref:pentapeptide repeat-containing protein n=1 Tax=Rivihabitans pingtungensis TaxID=1054498 RepID=UPI002FD90302
MAIIEIKNRWYGKVLYRGEHESLKEAVEALKNSTSHLPYGDLLDDVSLAHANLSGADLSGADLSGADLSGADL